MLSTLYVAPLAKIINSQGVSHTQYADIKFYIALSDTKAISTLRDCFEAVQHWLDLNGLSMNPDKTEAMVVGTAARQPTVGATGSIDLGEVSLIPSHSLGAAFSGSKRFHQHCSSPGKTVQYKLP